MALNIRATSFTTPISTGTQDVTIPGFGTPTAVMIIGGDPVGSPDIIWSWGVFDGTNQACRYAYAEEDTVGSNSAGHGYNDSTIIEAWVQSAGDNRRCYATASFITDGIQLNWTVADTQGRANYVAVLFSGTSAAVGTFVGAGTVDTDVNITGLGFKPRLLLTSTGNDQQPNVQSCQINMGVALDTGGSIENFQQNWGLEALTNPTYVTGAVRNDRGIFRNHNVQWFASSYIEITGMASGQFTHQAKVGSQSSYRTVYLALDLVNVDLETAISTGPVDTVSDWDPYTGTFTPQAVILLQGNSDNHNADTGWDVGFSFNIFVDDGEEYSVCFEADDGVTSGTVAVEGYLSDYLRNRQNLADCIVADDPTFDSTGLVFPGANVTTAAYASRKGMVIAIGTEGTANYDFTGPVDGDDRVYTGQTSVSLPGVWPSVEGAVYLNEVGAGKDGNEQSQVVESWGVEEIVVTINLGDLQAGDKDIIVETI